MTCGVAILKPGEVVMSCIYPLITAILLITGHQGLAKEVVGQTTSYPVHQDCPEGSAVTGMVIYSDTSIGRIRPVCERGELAFAGGTGAWRLGSLVCNRQGAAVGIYGRGTDQPKTLGLICPDGLLAGPVGTSGEPGGDLISCPSGETVRGFVTWLSGPDGEPGTFVRGLGIRCGMEPPPPRLCRDHRDRTSCVSDPRRCHWDDFYGFCSDEEPARECRDHRDRNSCRSDRNHDCIWDDYYQECWENSTVRECRDHRNRNRCERDRNNDCVWDDGRCFEERRRNKCRDHRNRRSCEQDGSGHCFWDADSRRCVDDGSPRWCWENTDQQSCRTDPYNACTWDDLYHQCLDESDVGRCRDHGNSYTCETDRFNDCWWHSDEDRCRRDGIRVRDCSQVSTLEACDHTSNCIVVNEFSCVGD